MGLKRYDIHKYMFDHQMATAWELLDTALAYESIGGHLMAEMFLFKACDVELLAFGLPPHHFPRARTFDEYVDKEVKWLPKFQRPALPAPREKPIAYVANTLYPRRCAPSAEGFPVKERPMSASDSRLRLGRIDPDYISFGRLAGSLLRVS